MKKKYCEECKKEHEPNAFCSKCGVCLYNNCKQIKDDKYPLFECLKCGKINF